MPAKQRHTAHTPGPWRIARTNAGLMIAGAVPGYLAEVRYCGTLESNEANAALIASAPDLLQESKRLNDLLGEAYQRNIALAQKADALVEALTTAADELGRVAVSMAHRMSQNEVQAITNASYAARTAAAIAPMLGEVQS